MNRATSRTNTPDEGRRRRPGSAQELEVHRRLVDELVNQYGGDVGNKTLFLTAAILMLVDRMPVGVEKSLDEIGYSLKELAIRSNLPPTQVTADDAPA